MNKLNLPPYAIALDRQDETLKVWDDLRRKWVRLTPEEWVRQHFIHFLIDHLGYPAQLLGNEVGLSLGGSKLRVDSILYDTQLRPKMLIEYKAPSIALSQQVLEQALRYNYKLEVPYLILSNGLEHVAYHINYEDQSYTRLDHIPHYKDI